MDEKVTVEKQENELVRLIQLLEEAGYQVLKVEDIKEPVRYGYIDLSIRRI